MTALTLQKAGHRVGLLNPTIYKARATAFKDITGAFPDAANVRANYVNTENADEGLAYVLRTFDEDSSLTVKKGYDNVTGVGSPTAKWLTAVK